MQAPTLIVAQEVECVVQLTEGHWFKSLGLWAACQTISLLDDEPQTACDEQLGVSTTQNLHLI